MLNCNIAQLIADKLTKEKYGAECDISDTLFSLLVNNLAEECSETFDLCEDEISCSTTESITCATVITQSFDADCTSTITITQL